MVREYDGDHVELRGEFRGPVVAKGNFYQQAAAPTALSALPARVAGFTGRGGELEELLRAFDPAGEGEAVLVAAVSGLGGIGKTALAVEAAHEARGKGWFPGGVLFLDLDGYGDDPVTGEQALETLLRALGVEPEHIPVRADERGRCIGRSSRSGVRCSCWPTTRRRRIRFGGCCPVTDGIGCLRRRGQRCLNSERAYCRWVN